MPLKTRDWMSLQEGLRGLYARRTLDELPRAILEMVERMVPSDLSAYNEIDPTRRRLVGVFHPESATPRIMPVIAEWERCMHQHPLVRHFQTKPNDSPKRITDFMPYEQFEQTDLYRAVFEPMNVRYQVVTAMPVPAPLIAGVAQNRGKKNFSDNELAMLDLLRPHLRQAYENACVVTDLAIESARLAYTLDRLDRGLILLDEGLRVINASPAAVRFLGQALRDEPLQANRLPATLERWAQRQVLALGQRLDTPAVPAPMLLETATGRLVVRLLRDLQPDRFNIVILHAARLESSEPLRGLGLTPREADVLYWCVEGKSRGEIGLLLGISERTVQKHLEHVYAKLDVSNRVGAVGKAIDWLRW